MHLAAAIERVRHVRDTLRALDYSLRDAGADSIGIGWVAAIVDAALHTLWSVRDGGALLARDHQQDAMQDARDLLARAMYMATLSMHSAANRSEGHNVQR